jgi:hypothetical protein
VEQSKEGAPRFLMGTLGRGCVKTHVRHAPGPLPPFDRAANSETAAVRTVIQETCSTWGIFRFVLRTEGPFCLLGRERILFRPGISYLQTIKAKHASDVSAIVQPNRLKSQRSFEAGRLELSLGTAYAHHHGPQADLRGQQGVSHLASSNQPNTVRMTPGPRQIWCPVTTFTADQNSHVMVLGGVPVAPCL